MKWECGADIVTKVESFHIVVLFMSETFIFMNGHFIGLGHFKLLKYLIKSSLNHLHHTVVAVLENVDYSGKLFSGYNF